MTTLTRRRNNPIAEIIGWLEADGGLGHRTVGLTPFVRIEDFFEEGAYVLRAEMPGIDPDKDLDVSVEGDVLTIRGERQEEKKERDRSEFHYGAFSRSIMLPRSAKADQISAEYVDGVLTLRVPMDAPVEEPRKVPVHRAESEGDGDVGDRLVIESWARRGHRSRGVNGHRLAGRPRLGPRSPPPTLPNEVAVDARRTELRRKRDMTTSTRSTATRSPTTPSLVDVGEITELVDRWAAKGLIDQTQAQRMRADLAVLPRLGGPGTPHRAGSVVVEALGYLGGVIMGVGALLIAAQYWGDLGTGWRLGIVAGTAAVLLLAGLLTPSGRGPRSVASPCRPLARLHGGSQRVSGAAGRRRPRRRRA